MSTTTTSDRNLDAEVRAVEEGHRALLGRDADGPFIRVVSDTRPGKSYRVTAAAAAGEGQPLVFTCRPIGALDGDDHRTVSNVEGRCPCKHAAVAARRLEREGLARFEPVHVSGARALATRWVSAIPAPAPEPTADDDPFAGFPQT